jgi:drug/metabolite transporter (DMT)-like permease
MLLSIPILKIKYYWNNWMGALISFIGVMLLCLMQIIQNSDSSGTIPNMSFGYLLGIGSALSYGISNVSMEYLMKYYSFSKDLSMEKKLNQEIRATKSSIEDTGDINNERPQEFDLCTGLILAVNSSFSVIWSILYFVSWSMEKELVFFSPESGSKIADHWLAVLVYMFSMVSFYCLLPVMISRASAALLNLSLLTVNLMSIPIAFWICNEPLNFEFIAPCIIVIAGILVFNIDLRSARPS